MKKYLGVFIVFLSLTSCLDQDVEDRKQIEQIALGIQQGMQEGRAYDIQEFFSPTRFAMRLGDSFYDLPKVERQITYKILREVYSDAVNSFMDQIEAFNYKVDLFDLHEKDGIYRLNYEITDHSSKYTYNYLVFYLEKDKKDQWRIVNYYNLLTGFSLGQIGKQQLKDITLADRTSHQMKVTKARNNVDRAIEIADTGNYSFAYEVLNYTSKSFLERGNTAYLKVLFASQISDSLYLKELKWIEKVTPNQQSKLLYQCIQNRVENFELEFGECGDKIKESLKNT